MILQQRAQTRALDLECEKKGTEGSRLRGMDKESSQKENFLLLPERKKKQL